MSRVEYGKDVTVRQLRHNGEVKWKGRCIYVSEALVGEPVGFKQIGEDTYEISFSFHSLGVLNERTGKIASNTKL